MEEMKKVKKRELNRLELIIFSIATLICINWNIVGLKWILKNPQYSDMNFLILGGVVLLLAFVYILFNFLVKLSS